MAQLSVIATTGGLICTITGLDSSYSYNDRQVIWQASLNGSSVINTSTTLSAYESTTSYTMTGLTSGVTYTIKVGIYKTNPWTQLALLTGSGTPTQLAPSLSVTTSGTTQINATVGPLQYTGSLTIDWKLYDVDSGTLLDSQSSIMSNPTGSSVTQNFYNVTTDKALYKVTVDIYSSQYDYNYSFSQQVGTAPPYTLKATINFSNGTGASTTSSISSTQKSYDTTGNISVTFPSAPTKDGYIFDYWTLSYGSTTYETLYYPENTYSIYAVRNGITYTATAHWTKKGSGKVYVWVGDKWRPAIPYVWAGNKWCSTTPYVWINGKWR